MKIPVLVRMVFYFLIDILKLLLTVAAIIAVTGSIIWAMANMEVVETVVGYVVGTFAVLVALLFSSFYVAELHEKAVTADKKNKKKP